MEDTLTKIRHQKNSALAHQKAPANLLMALEATMTEQKTDRSPAAYFALLLTTLESTLKTGNASGPALGEGDILPAELYLLSTVIPYVPPAVVRTHLNSVLSITAPLWPQLNEYAPPLRSQLNIYESIIRSLERSHLDIQAIRQSFAFILQLCLDGRPKVRRRAVELVRNVLSRPPSPLVRHPYGEKVSAWALSALADVTSGVLKKGKGKGAEEDSTSAAIHLVSSLKLFLPFFPPSEIPPVIAALLSIPRIGNPYLSEAAYLSLTQALNHSSQDDLSSSNITSQISEILKVITASQPSQAEAHVLPSWLNAIGQTMLFYYSVDKENCTKELPKVWKTVFSALESGNGNTRKAAAASLICLSECLSELLDPITIDQTVSQLITALNSITYVRAITEVLAVISAFITGLSYRSDGRESPTAAEVHVLPILEKLSDLRIKSGFQQKEAADNVFRTALSTMGAEVLFRALPLNLEPSDRAAGREPRAFLLPLLTTPHPTPLRHFISYFVPLTERMFDLQQRSDSEGRASEAKLWSVLISQIWNGLAGYCHGTPDIQQSMTPQFSQMLSQILYNQPDLRLSVLKSLRILIECQVSLSSDMDRVTTPWDAYALTPEESSANLTFLKSQSDSWFAVLFNVFGSIGREGQGVVGDVIVAWASITDDNQMRNTAQKVVDLFKINLKNEAIPAAARGAKSNVAMSMQDILVLLVPYIPVSEAKYLFQFCLTQEVLSNKDHAVQKRGYKILHKLIESGSVKPNSEEVLALLDQVSDEVAPAAKKDRMNLLTSLLAHLPSTSLHVFPSLIPEAVLGTKEPSEKARTAAFDFIVEMGRKMKEGGVIRRDKLEDMDSDNAKEVSASVDEYLTMIAGGLAGASPHMISATITAISRLIFEFKDDISLSMLSEILSTILMFLSSANREIVKSSLGFIKLAVHTLSVDLVKPQLGELVPALLRWSHDHKNHFKAKVRHIFERMIRRYGWDDVYGKAGEEEASKVLLNIKKRKERARRQKAHTQEESENEEEPKAAAGEAFEDVLYGSESELEDSDEEHKAVNTKKKGLNAGPRLRMDGDVPMDLLEGAATHVLGGSQKQRRKPGQEASKFKEDRETGKMLIESDDADADDAEAVENVEGDAYRESITSVDGFTRGPNGRIKFNKDTKKRKRMNLEDEDVDMGDEASKKPSSKRTSGQGIGTEFKAKKAGGDVKRGGVDPYAYLSLKDAAKKGGKGRNRMRVLNK